MATAVAGPPHPDRVTTNVRQLTGKGDRVAIVLDLRPRIDLLSRLAVTRAETPVVEDQHGQTGLGKALGVGVEIHLLDRREPVRHHDGRQRT
jgi:hypothetical protein